MKTETPPVKAAPDRLRLSAQRAQFAAEQGKAVDASAGVIKGVALITADREASGHGVWIDAKTVQQFADLLAGRKLKAYATHDNAGLDGTLDEVGYWQDARVDGAVLRADFIALDAWKKFYPGEYATLFELADKLPAEFGASLTFSLTLAWVMPDGSEVVTQRGIEYNDNGAEYAFNPPMPEGAVRAMPSVRPNEIYSADFVNEPAANDGLFQAKHGIKPAETPAAAPVKTEPDADALALHAHRSRRLRILCLRSPVA
jgi:hypothetical protein